MASELWQGTAVFQPMADFTFSSRQTAVRVSQDILVVISLQFYTWLERLSSQVPAIEEAAEALSGYAHKKGFVTSTLSFTCG